MNLRIRGGRIVDPSQSLDRQADLWLDRGKIAALLRTDEESPSKPDREIDARGLIVAPGFVDLHTHLREPGQVEKEDIESGTRAAVAGGFTSILCMANTSPPNDSVDVTRWILSRARETASCRVYPVGAISVGLKGEELAPLEELKLAGCVAISDDGRPVNNAALLRSAMEKAREIDLPVIAHCQELAVEEDLDACESIDLARVLLIAAELNARVHAAHLSCAASIELVREYRRHVQTITAEATPHHLMLTKDAIGKFGANAKMYPPLRHSEDREALRRALSDGTLQAIATDHAPHTKEEKSRSFESAPNGVIGLDTALPVLLRLVKEGGLSLSRLVEVFSTEPARIAGLAAGSLRPGSPADVVLFRAEGERILVEADLYSRSRNSPFIGFSGVGRVERTLVGGEQVFPEKET